MKKADCDRARRDLLRSPTGVEAATARHLEDCSSCAAFAAGLAALRSGCERHRAGVVPDEGFAGRVIASLPPREHERDTVGWAAVRLLPATLALALVLAAWCWTRTVSPASLVAGAPTDDVLSWVLEDGEPVP